MTPEDYKDNKNLTVIDNEPMAADEQGHIYSDGPRPELISRDTCRMCLNKIKPWAGVYWKFEWFCGPVFYKYSCQNSYCEECAKLKGQEKTKPVNAPEVDYIGHDAQGLPITHWKDGYIEYEDDEDAKFKRSYF